MILKAIFTVALYVSGGGYVFDTKFGLHHYSDKDYEELFYLKKKVIVSKKCIRHNENENVKKLVRYHNGERKTVYVVTKNKETDS
tara:strand:+ start:145 stop:399 length:255 start_codon:yes stop_codon:yes gene_type:complete